MNSKPRLYEVSRKCPDTISLNGLLNNVKVKADSKFGGIPAVPATLVVFLMNKKVQI